MEFSIVIFTIVYGIVHLVKAFKNNCFKSLYRIKINNRSSFELFIAMWEEVIIKFLNNFVKPTVMMISKHISEDHPTSFHIHQWRDTISWCNFLIRFLSSSDWSESSESSILWISIFFWGRFRMFSSQLWLFSSKKMIFSLSHGKLILVYC